MFTSKLTPRRSSSNKSLQSSIWTSSLNRSVQISQITEEAPNHRLEKYGSELPVLVREALSSNSQAKSSVSISASSWAWLVVGRKLYIWNFSPSLASKGCRELSLPPSTVSYSSKQIIVYTQRNGNQVCCAAVSSEGHFRYWSSIVHEGSFTETTLNVSGEVCAQMINIKNNLFVIATTSSSFFLVNHAALQNVLSSRKLSKPQGVLTGVGRRMSSFIWGPATNLASPELHKLISGEALEDGSVAFYALTGSSLQKWAIYSNYEKFLYEFDVEKELRSHISQAVWKQDECMINNLKTWCLDVELARDGVVILGAGINSDISCEVHYVLGTLHTEGMESPQSFLSFTVPQFTLPLQEEEDESIVKFNLLLPDPKYSNAYIHNSTSVICFSSSNSSEPYDRVNFEPPSDGILGSGHFAGKALFFSKVSGIVTLVNSIHIEEEKSLNSSSLSNLSSSFARNDSPLSKLDDSRILDMSQSHPRNAQLRTAFIYNCRKQFDSVSQLVSQIIEKTNQNETIDELVIDLSEEMIDDIPDRDPRWAEAIPGGLGMTSESLILKHQLEDKLKAHELYLDFLKSSDIWDKLSVLAQRGVMMGTGLMLCEHAEKILSGMSLHSLHTKYSQIIDDAIKKVLADRGDNPQNGLSHLDLFFRKCSRIQDIIEPLITQEEDFFMKDASPTQMVQLASSVNLILLNIIHDAVQFRQTKKNAYHCITSFQKGLEYIPWTASLGNNGIRTLLHKQYTLTSELILPLAQDTQELNLLYSQLLEIADTILDGYRTQLESIRQSVGENSHYHNILQKYEKDRRQLLYTFMKEDQFERATTLAEKYCDFGILVEICESTNNQDRLNRYMTQFQNKGFSDFVFKWYVEKGQPGKLISSQLASHPQLSSFLHSSNNKHISWLHDIRNGDFNQASTILKDLSYNEEAFVGRKKTMLSLSKLSALASDEPLLDCDEHIQDINNQLDLIFYQESLPDDVLKNLNMEPANMKVFTAQELIQLYIGNCNSRANEFDFKKALDLLQFLNKNCEEYTNTLINIWCRAVLCDNWSSLRSDNPLDIVQATVFFKTVELAFTEGLDLKECLPPVDVLIESDHLQEIKFDSNFKFLLKAGYEQIARIIS